MATRQVLRGGTEKIYEIVNSFNKGYNTNVADDLLNESYFRSINNMLPSEEGNVTKRPGITKMGLYKLFDELINHAPEYPDVSLSLYNINAQDLLDYLFRMKPYSVSNHQQGQDTITTAESTPYTLGNFTLLDDTNGLFGKTNDLSELLTNDNLYNKEIVKDVPSADWVDGATSYLSFVVIFVNKCTLTSSTQTAGGNSITEGKSISIFNVNISYSAKFSKEGGAAKKNIAVTVEYKLPDTVNYAGDDIISMEIFNDEYYFMNGLDSIVKVPKLTNGVTTVPLNEKIQFINKQTNTLYKPTAIEVKNIGFNILSENPMEYIDNQGTANSIRGVFYTYNNQPTQTIPYNKEFKIHLLASGSGENQHPKYRPNNGEIDVEKNPYKDLPGSYNNDKTVFTCSGLNESESLELMVEKGTESSANKFLAYITMGSVVQSDIGKIEDISKLILSSKYCKIINNQLVLFGNHGYMFFSDYNNFTYFPNYYYVYIAESENEEAVSINYFRQYYAIFTNKRIKRMTGAFGSDNFGIYPLNDYVGCTNPATVKQVSNYLYFLSDNGLYMLKQGYVGEGTENVEQIDLPIYKSYITENMLRGCTFMNYYALFSEHEVILYNYAISAYYRFKMADIPSIPDEENGSVFLTSYTIPFQYNKLPSCLFYGIREKMSDTVTKFDICKQDFSFSNDVDITDNGVSIVSSAETCAMSFGSPTNMKKFKEIYLKIYNKYGKLIPLYVTIIVDDKVVISPKQYVVDYDEETNTYYYNERIGSNKDLKGYNVLGTLTLGEDIIGERTMQVLKMKVREKGRSIKIIISDGIENGEEGYKLHQNNYRFDLSTIGVVYKLKKVKEV